MVWPDATLVALAEPLVADSPFLLDVDDLTELAFFTEGGVAAASVGALRLRSSGIAT